MPFQWIQKSDDWLNCCTLCRAAGRGRHRRRRRKDLSEFGRMLQSHRGIPISNQQVIRINLFGVTTVIAAVYPKIAIVLYYES